MGAILVLPAPTATLLPVTTLRHRASSMPRSVPFSTAPPASPTTGLSLILSSNSLDHHQFWHAIQETVELAARHKANGVITIVYVPTASLFLDPDSTSNKSPGERRSRARASMRKKMKAVEASLNGWEVDPMRPPVKAEWLDLAAVAEEDEVKQALLSADAVYVEGGNTWFLAHHMRRTRFDAALAEMKSGVYIGISAGAIVAGRSLATTLWKGWDKPIEELDVADPDQLQGLNLGGGLSFFPHYTVEWDEVVAAQGPLLEHDFVLLGDQQSRSPKPPMPTPADATGTATVPPAAGVELDAASGTATASPVAPASSDDSGKEPVENWVLLSSHQAEN